MGRQFWSSAPGSSGVRGAAVIGFEVKAASRVAGEDFAGLRKLRDLLGGAFVGGVAFYTGARSYTYEDRLHVMPIDRLWQ